MSGAEIAFSEEEGLLAYSAYELLGKRSDFASVRRWLESDSGYDDALFREIAELGWLGVAVPAEYGGAGLGVHALTAMVEAMGRQLFASPFLASTLAAQVLLQAGSEAQRRRWLPLLVRGAAIGSVALHEASGSYALDRFDARAERHGSGFLLHGEKAFALDAQHADFVLCAVTLEGRPAFLLVEKGALVGRLRRELLIDERRRSARLQLNGLELAADALLDGGDAASALAHVQRCAWLLLAAEMAGGAEGVLALTTEYLKTRVQFGRPIGSYQALKHPLVEIMCALEQGRSLLYHASTMFARGAPSPAPALRGGAPSPAPALRGGAPSPAPALRGDAGAPPEGEVALRMAKAQLGDTYARAVDRAVQFHGAIGFTYECHAQLFFRHAQWCQASFGDSLHHRRALADLLWPK